ncbi:MAG: DUF4168 domain-containing protein [cyanobacterium endosymbiont of Rhopalodia musculus]|uniref:DUF4168 domain-containing protein n=1 Tax=cyanobacterium endosymbiont of Epithemia clementina EcSB TaxID=3034674 RepID=UPI002480759E|nr:DUF4168 domain-containing protein [cyanobacterium endosymbiont of Epithemia clementina EcSB]WGT67691.1 DUF4168 domain-containing protein [cyanobacterium endosymbiont of Epithemia clementina EcSB]
MFQKLLLGEFIGVLPLLLGVGGLPTWSQTENYVLGSAFKQITEGYTIAQTSTNPTVKDLEKFALIVKKQRSLAQETKQKMLKVLESEGLSRQRFREIAQEKSDTGASIGNFSDEDLKKFENVFPEVKKIAQEDLLRQRELVKSQGFTIQEFNAIATKVQNNPSLQREVLKLMKN